MFDVPWAISWGTNRVQTQYNQRLLTKEWLMESWWQFDGGAKVIFPKYSKHWPYTVVHTIDCVCSKMLNHGWNNVLFCFWLVKLTPWHTVAFLPRDLFGMLPEGLGYFARFRIYIFIYLSRDIGVARLKSPVRLTWISAWFVVVTPSCQAFDSRYVGFATYLTFKLHILFWHIKRIL